MLLKHFGFALINTISFWVLASLMMDMCPEYSGRFAFSCVVFILLLNISRTEYYNDKNKKIVADIHLRVCDIQLQVSDMHQNPLIEIQPPSKKTRGK